MLRRTGGLVTFLLLAAMVFSLPAAGKNYLAAVSDYTSERGKSLAQKYSGLLERAVTEVTSVYPSSDLRIITLDECAVGGAGFFKNPVKGGADTRYMSMVVMVKKPPYLFGNDRNGRVASVLDRYGKSILAALTRQMETVGPPGVDGVAFAIVWGDTVIGNPAKIGSEGMLLFLAKQDVIMYKRYKLTIQKLVNRNDLFLFSGSEEIENLLQFILEI